MIKPDGTGFRKLASKQCYCLGSPKWSPDGKRIVYYQLTTENTWDAHRPESVASAQGQIYSVDFATGKDITQHTFGKFLKVSPQWITSDVIGYLIKGGTSPGLNYTSYGEGRAYFSGTMRTPSWSPDGKQVIYEKQIFTPSRPMEKKLWSWQSDWEYRFTDVFPDLSNQGRLAITQKQLDNSSVVTMKPDGMDLKLIFDPLTDGNLSKKLDSSGLAGAFQPSWSPNGKWLTFGVGAWFRERAS